MPDAIIVSDTPERRIAVHDESRFDRLVVTVRDLGGVYVGIDLSMDEAAGLGATLTRWSEERLRERADGQKFGTWPEHEVRP